MSTEREQSNQEQEDFILDEFHLARLSLQEYVLDALIDIDNE